MWDAIRQALCGLRGHDEVLHYEEARLSLTCVSCGHETPGWSLTETPPTLMLLGDPRRNGRHAMVARQLA